MPWNLFKLRQPTREWRKQPRCPHSSKLLQAELLEARRVLASPSLVVDIVPGADGTQGGGYGSSVPTGLTEFKGSAYFAASAANFTRGIWRTDGTASGTEVVAVIRPSPQAPYYNKDSISQLTASGDYLFFRELTGSNLFSNSKLWRTDGTASGTLLLRDFGAKVDVRHLTNVDGKLFFSVNYSADKEELWRSDGTSAGTVRLGAWAEISTCNSAVFGSHYGKFTSVGGDVYFGAVQTPRGSCSLIKWESKTEAFVTLQTIRGAPSCLKAIGERVVYALFPQTGFPYFGELWQTDGTPTGTTRLARLTDPGEKISGVVEVGGKLFVATGPGQLSLPSKVMLLENSAFVTIYTSATQGESFLLRAWGDELFVVEKSVGKDVRFLKIASADLRVSLLREFRDWGVQNSGWGLGASVGEAYVIHPNGLLYFAASGTTPRTVQYGATPLDSVAVYDIELWESDGTAEGTRVYDVTPEWSTVPETLAILREDVLYSASSRESGKELWRFRPSTLAGPTTPSSPESMAAASGDGQVVLTWSVPANNGGVGITDYIVQFKAVAATAWSTFADGISTSTSANVTGLTNGTTYVFRVAAVNSEGAGSYAELSAGVVPATVPTTPANLTTSSGNSQVRLTWSAPANNGGAAVTDYVVQFKTIAATAWSTFADGRSTNTSATVTGLTNGTGYVFRVLAVNTAGAGAESSVFATPRTVASAPLSLGGTPGNSQVRLAWIAPTNNGGSAITDYVVQFKTIAATTWSTFADGRSTNTSATVTGLANGTGYVFRVLAVNAAGAGAESSVFATPRTVASAPLSLGGTPGNSQVRLTWSSPANNGGAAVTDYVVQFKTIAATAWSTFADGRSTNTSATVTGLTNGTGYVFRVLAVNTAGLSSWSNESAAFTPFL
jgi:ELWxxDGT repeat protein